MDTEVVDKTTVEQEYEDAMKNAPKPEDPGPEIQGPSKLPSTFLRKEHYSITEMFVNKVMALLNQKKKIRKYGIDTEAWSGRQCEILDLEIGNIDIEIKVTTPKGP